MYIGLPFFFLDVIDLQAVRSKDFKSSLRSLIPTKQKSDY